MAKVTKHDCILMSKHIPVFLTVVEPSYELDEFEKLTGETRLQIAQRVFDDVLSEAMDDQRAWIALKQRLVRLYPELANHWSVDALMSVGIVKPAPRPRFRRRA